MSLLVKVNRFRGATLFFTHSGEVSSCSSHKSGAPRFLVKLEGAFQLCCHFVKLDRFRDVTLLSTHSGDVSCSISKSAAPRLLVELDDTFQFLERSAVVLLVNPECSRKLNSMGYALLFSVW